MQSQFERQMFFTHDALAKHLHFVLEQRRFKALSPHLVLQGGRHIDPQMLAFQWAIGEHGALQGGGRQPLLSQVLQGLLERCQVLGSQGAACGHRVATKAQQDVGVRFADRVQRIAQMKTRQRSP